MKYKRFFVMILTIILTMKSAIVTAETVVPEELRSLYAVSACLMDAESGRVLFEKNAEKIMPMASTTKIMTCIVTLENADLADLVKISSKAARQPDVQLNVNTDETYYLKDLLYSLMLESHNDAAYAIAEHVGGSTENFAAMMNQKAVEIGCENTYFITPNGLDASDEKGIHGTTAKDLAAIMSYCILKSEKKEDFLKITRTENYTFCNVVTSENGTRSVGKRSFSCNNHNAFLSMMEGAISGKTGFTAKAGYCYVGALERNGKKLVVSLLACGWPNNKAYKWSDTKKLMNYGLNQYSYYSFADISLDENKLKPLVVTEGQTEKIGGVATVQVKIIDGKKSVKGLLMREDERVDVIYRVKEKVAAPVKENEVVGTIQYLVNGNVWEEKELVLTESIEKIDIVWCLKKIGTLFLKFD